MNNIKQSHHTSVSRTAPDKHRALLKCDFCSEDIYPFELVHKIDGLIICPDCFFDFAFDYFSDRLILASELRGNTNDIN